MEKEITHYVYIYIEIANNGAPYLMHQEISPDLMKEVGAAFRDHGGINIITEINIEKRITSVWNTPGGYNRWLADDRVKPYIDLRNSYNSQNNITSTLSGPFTHTLTKQIKDDE